MCLLPFVHFRRLKNSQGGFMWRYFLVTDVKALDKLLLKAVTDRIYPMMVVNSNKKVNQGFNNVPC